MPKSNLKGKAPKRSRSTATGHNHSEQKTEELLQKLEQQARVFDTTLSSITDFAYIFDRDGRFLYVNQALLDLWGLRLDDAVGKNFYDLQYPPDLAERLQEQIQQVITTRTGLRARPLTPAPQVPAGITNTSFGQFLVATATSNPLRVPPATLPSASASNNSCGKVRSVFVSSLNRSKPRCWRALLNWSNAIATS